MSGAVKDENDASSIIAASSADGKTVIRVLADPTTHRLKVKDGTTGTNHGSAHSLHDENDVPSWLAASSADGVTPISVYADSSGNLLIDSM